MDELTFLRPWWFAALLPTLAVAWWFLRFNTGDKRFHAIVDPALTSALIDAKIPTSARTASTMLVLATTLVIVALAGPTWRHGETPAYRDLKARVVILDLSPVDAGRGCHAQPA